MNPVLQDWFSPAVNPVRFELLEVQLADNSVTRGVWTGVQWWCEGRAVRPQAWRPARRDQSARREPND